MKEKEISYYILKLRFANVPKSGKIHEKCCVQDITNTVLCVPQFQSETTRTSPLVNEFNQSVRYLGIKDSDLFLKKNQ